MSDDLRQITFDERWGSLLEAARVRMEYLSNLVDTSIKESLYTKYDILKSLGVCFRIGSNSEGHHHFVVFGSVFEDLDSETKEKAKTVFQELIPLICSIAPITLIYVHTGVGKLKKGPLKHIA